MNEGRLPCCRIISRARVSLRLALRLRADASASGCLRCCRRSGRQQRAKGRFSLSVSPMSLTLEWCPGLLDRSPACMVLADGQLPRTGSGMVHAAAHPKMNIPAAESSQVYAVMHRGFVGADHHSLQALGCKM